MRPSIVRCGIIATVSCLSAWLAAGEPGEKPASDRVGLPSDYRNKLTLIRRVNVPNKQQAAHVYANEAAAAVTELGQLPYPNGAILVFEWADSEKNADGTPVTGPDGLWQRGAVRQVDVMRREAGYGEGYGESRAGEWEFARYTPDGTLLLSGAGTQSCAKCHAGAAERDFVFRGRFPEMEKK